MKRIRAFLARTSLFALVLFCWSTSWYAAKYQLAAGSMVVSITLRIALSAGLMFALMRLRGVKLQSTLRDHARFAAQGALMFSCNFFLAYEAARYLPSGLVAVIFSFASVTNLIFGHFAFGERVTVRSSTGALVGIAGLCLMFAPQFSAVGHVNVARGLLCAVGMTLCFTLANAMANVNMRRGHSVEAVTCWSLIYGAFWCLAAVALNTGSLQINWSTSYVVAMLFTVVFSTVLAFWSYLALLRRVGLAKAGYATILFPVGAMLISSVSEGYAWSAASVSGVILIAVGNGFVLGKTPDKSSPV